MRPVVRACVVGSQHSGEITADFKGAVQLGHEVPCGRADFWSERLLNLNTPDCITWKDEWAPRRFE